MILNTKEKRIIEKWKYSFIDFVPKGRTEIISLVVFVSDTRKLHDSGYPLIQIFGEVGY